MSFLCIYVFIHMHIHVCDAYMYIHICMHIYCVHIYISLLSPILPGNFLLEFKSVDGYGSKGTDTLPSPEMPFRITAEDLYLYQGLAVSQTSLEGSLEGFVFPMLAASRC